MKMLTLIALTATLADPVPSSTEARLPAQRLEAEVSAAPVMTGPRLLNQPDVLRDSDYPAEAAAAVLEGNSRAEVTVDPSGRQLACRTTQSSGFVSLDTQTCALILQRAKFDPARDDRGRPVMGLFRYGALWFLPDIGKAELPLVFADYVYEVAELPTRQKSYVTRVDILLGKNDPAPQCHVEKPGVSAKLDSLACQLAAARSDLRPAGTDLSGDVVISLEIGFVGGAEQIAR